jgi:hypothetical protein
VLLVVTPYVSSCCWHFGGSSTAHADALNCHFCTVMPPVIPSSFLMIRTFHSSSNALRNRYFLRWLSDKSIVMQYSCCRGASNNQALFFLCAVSVCQLWLISAPLENVVRHCPPASKSRYVKNGWQRCVSFCGWYSGTLVYRRHYCCWSKSHCFAPVKTTTLMASAARFIDDNHYKCLQLIFSFLVCTARK